MVIGIIFGQLITCFFDFWGNSLFGETPRPNQKFPHHFSKRLFWEVQESQTLESYGHVLSTCFGKWKVTYVKLFIFYTLETLRRETLKFAEGGCSYRGTLAKLPDCKTNADNLPCKGALRENTNHNLKTTRVPWGRMASQENPGEMLAFRPCTKWKCSKLHNRCEDMCRSTIPTVVY